MADLTSQTSGTQSDEVERVVLGLLQAKTGGRGQLSDHVSLLDLDSLALAELSLEIEKSLNVRLDEGILEAQTVRDIVDYVTRLRTKKRPV